MLSFLFDLAVIFLEVCLIELSVCVLSHLSRVGLFVTLWTIARQAPLSMGFSRQEHWSGLPCSSLGDLPNPGIKPRSLTSPALAGGFFTTSASWENQVLNYVLCKHYKTMEY